MNACPEKPLLILGHLLVAAVLLFPVWYVDIVPMPDFAGHMARIHTLASLDTNPTLAEMYEAHWNFLPNIAVDVFVLGAMKFVPLIAAGKLYISISVLLWMAGTAWLHRALSGEWSIVPLFAAPFVLNANFFLGFLSFMVGAGVALLGLAAWAAMSSWKPMLRLIAILPLTMLAYFSHVVGYVILALCILGFELGQELIEPRKSWRRGLRRLFLASTALLPVVAIYIFLSPHENHEAGWLFGNILQSYTRIRYAIYLTYAQPYFAALIVIVLACGLGLATRRLTFARRMWPILIGLTIAAVLAPIKMVGGAFVQIRLPPIIGCLGIASLQDRAGRLPKILLGCILAALLGYRAIAMIESWTPYDRDYAELASAIDAIEPGSKLFLAQVQPTSGYDYEMMMIYSHFLDLISVRRNIFSPLVFAWPTQHPLRTTAPYRSLGANSSHQGIPADARDLPTLAAGESGAASDRFPYLVRWQCHFDYLVIFQLTKGINPVPAMLEVRATGKFFTLYKITGGNGSCPGS